MATISNAPLTIAQLLELHPWPADWADHPSNASSSSSASTTRTERIERIERMWIHEVPGTPEELWPFLSDTSRMNRALGTAEMKFEERDGKRFGTAKPGGVRHAWIELPWSWVANQWLTSLRVYERGFFRAVWAVHRLEPIATGTRIYLYFGTVARNALAGFAIRLGFPAIERAYKRVLPALAQQLDRSRPDVLVLPAPPLSEAAAHRLRTQRDTLIARGLAPECVDTLIEWIRTGDDQDLHRIQIRERARVWNLPETELLKVALYATRAGVLTLSWDTVCPHCRGVRDQHEHLAALEASARCDACQVTFTTDTQESVEVTFHVHPSIRDVPEQQYCSAEPAKKSHIRVQWMLPPGGEVVVTPRLERGRYTVRRSHQGGWYLDIDDRGEPKVPWQLRPAGTICKAAPGADIELHNDGGEPALFTIEQATWSDHALRAGQLLSFQEFRDLFSEEYIGADVRLGVGEQTLLFTDVVGSTAFYAARGDPAAFIEIKRHFDEVFAIVAAHRGAVVKTIGDAVMATFIDPIDSLRASYKIHQTFHPTRADTPIRLRISLNTGPCIAVRLNSNADFFGGTVNVAAKLQSLVEGYQIAISDATYGAPGVASYLAEQEAQLERLSYTSQSLPAPVGIRRWTVFSEPA